MTQAVTNCLRKSKFGQKLHETSLGPNHGFQIFKRKPLAYRKKFIYKGYIILFTSSITEDLLKVIQRAKLQQKNIKILIGLLKCINRIIEILQTKQATQKKKSHSKKMSSPISCYNTV